jgi:hypothetical protein
MIDKEWLKAYPSRRIKPVDGMAVTAALWEEAHDYHQQMQRAHNMLSHGPGILAGLEVIASDPPDTSIYILPGFAIDTDGTIIILAEPTTYDMGNTQGPLHVLLTFGEGLIRMEKGPDPVEDSPYVYAQFGIEARASIEGKSGVELMRIHREGTQAPITNALNPEQPGPNEIDLRFRREIGAAVPEIATMALSYVDGSQNEQHNRGAVTLGRAMRQVGKTSLWVDHDIQLDADLEKYSLIYLIGQGEFKLKREIMDALYNYLQGGGTVLFESCRQGNEEPPADAAFLDMIGSLGIKLEEVEGGHPLLSEPHFFAAPASGAVVEGESKLLVGGGVVYSSFDYGCLWQGTRHGAAASREEIRAGHEFGHNLIAYALRRKRDHSA